MKELIPCFGLNHELSLFIDALVDSFDYIIEMNDLHALLIKT